MGNKSSGLTSKPWRDTIGWEASARDNLIQQVTDLHPGTNPQIPRLNMLVAGPIGSGKSSFINSATAVLRGGVHLAAGAGTGEMDKSFTRKFHVYQIKQDLPCRIFDTVGLDSTINNDSDVKNVIRTAEGHVPVGYEFKPEEEFTEESPGYIVHPTLADKAHCVAIVVNAETVGQLPKLMEEKLKCLAKCLHEKEILCFVLLTRVEKFCPHVGANVTTMYHSIALENLVIKIRKMINGLPKNHVWPIINYVEKVDKDIEMDVPLLYALRAMLGAAKGFVEKQNTSKVKIPIEFGVPETDKNT